MIKRLTLSAKTAMMLAAACVALSLQLGIPKSGSVHASTKAPETEKLSKAQRQKRFLEQQKKKWPNLSGPALKNHLSVVLNIPLYDNPKLAQYVQDVGEKVLAQTPHAGQDYRFLLLDDPNPNAFTQQQPYIYVNRGLLAIYQSEAQLAGVLAHEIGHNIDKGVTKRKNKRLTDSIFATTMSILAGNTNVGNAIATQQVRNQAKYSRERELEADRLGANYLYGAGYDSEGLLKGLGSLFDFVKLQTKTNTVQYRDLQTHPRNDKRLRAVLNEIGELPPGEAYQGREAYRDAIDGMVYGPNLRRTAPPGYVRYNNPTLGITFLHPEEWDRTIKGSKIIVQNPDDTIQFQIEIEKTADKTQSSEDAIKAKYPDKLTGLTKINPQASKDLGVVAVNENKRVGLIKVARNTYHFRGLSRNNKLSKAEDDVLVGMIASFRRMTPRDRNLTQLKRIYFEQLKPGETFESIAANEKDENVATEPELRALNGFSAREEAEPGTWIKKIKLVKVDQNDRKADSADGKSVASK